MGEKGIRNRVNMATSNGHNGSGNLPGAANLQFVESLHEDYLRDPASVSPDWQRYFSQFAENEFRFPKPRFQPSFRPFSIFNPPSSQVSLRRAQLADPEVAALQDLVYA